MIISIHRSKPINPAIGAWQIREPSLLRLNPSQLNPLSAEVIDCTRTFPSVIIGSTSLAVVWPITSRIMSTMIKSRLRCKVPWKQITNSVYRIIGDTG